MQKLLEKVKIKKFLLYAMRWQCGTPIIYFSMTRIPIENDLIRTVIANVIGAAIFFPIDLLLFKKPEVKKDAEKATV